MKYFRLNNKSHRLPEKLSELNAEQLSGYFYNLHQHISSFTQVKDNKLVITDSRKYNSARMYILLMLLNFNQGLMHQLSIQQPVIEEGEHLLDLELNPLYFSNAKFLIDDQKVCDWLFTVYHNSDLVINKVPAIGTYCGPSNEFDDIRVEEYFYADKLYMEYRRNPSPELLARMCAVLYRPQKKNIDTNAHDWDGDYREPFNPITADSRIQYFMHPDRRPVLACTYLYWEGCRNKTIKDNNYLFNPSKTSRKGPPLTDEESMLQLCGGAEKYERNRHMKINILFPDLNAKAKQI